MSPTPRFAGIAGVLAGIGLTLEFALFMASGWTPTVLSHPAGALDFLQSGGTLLRAAAFVGFLNLALAMLWIVGLSAQLARSAPNGAAATRYLGLAGMTAHALVPLGLWLAVPAFLDLAAREPQAAAGGWTGFAALVSSAGGVGYLFDGFAMIAAGWALRAGRLGSSALGWVGLVAGAASAVSVLADETILDALAQAAFMPALILTIGFRLWSGIVLWRGAGHAARHEGTRMMASAA